MKTNKSAPPITLIELFHATGITSLQELWEAEDELQRHGLLQIDRRSDHHMYTVADPRMRAAMAEGWNR